MHFVNKYMRLKYDPIHYNCWHFFKEVQANEFGRSLPEINIDTSKISDVIRAFKQDQYYQAWERIDTPKEGDAVLMGLRGKNSHIGIFVDVGYSAVLHNDNLGNHGASNGVRLTPLSDFYNGLDRQITCFMRPINDSNCA